MGILTVTGAQLLCSFGTAPSGFAGTSAAGVLAENKGAGTAMDVSAMTNLLPFGMCTSMANPQVAAATAAALGVLTPQPCVPAAAGVWTGACSKVLVKGAPALDMQSKCMCTMGMGIIQIQNPGQNKIMLGT